MTVGADEADAPRQNVVLLELTDEDDRCNPSLLPRRMYALRADPRGYI